MLPAPVLPPCSAAQACWVCHGSLCFSFILRWCLGKGHPSCPASAALGCSTPPHPAHIPLAPAPASCCGGGCGETHPSWSRVLSVIACKGTAPLQELPSSVSPSAPFAPYGEGEPLAAVPGVADSAVPGSAPAWGLSIQQNEACSCRGVDVCTRSPGPGPTGVPIESDHPFPASLAPPMPHKDTAHRCLHTCHVHSRHYRQ